MKEHDPKAMAEAEFRKEFPNAAALLEDEADSGDLRFDARDVHTAFLDGYLAGMIAVKGLIAGQPAATEIAPAGCCQVNRDGLTCNCSLARRQRTKAIGVGVRQRKVSTMAHSLSPEARAALEAGLESARTQPSVYLGSFAQYADDDDE